MPKTVSDIRIVEFTQRGDSVQVSYHLLDADGKQTGGLMYAGYVLDADAKFSDTLGFTDGTATVKKDGAGKARTVHDLVKDHASELRNWLKAKIKAAEGL